MVLVSGSDEDLIRGSVAALNSGDVDGYLAGFSPDCRRWISGLDTPLTLSEVDDNLRQMMTAFDRLHLREDLLFGDNGYVYARWTLRGVHTGDHVGIAPTQREIAVQTSEVYAVTGAPVTASWKDAQITSSFDQLENHV